MLHAAQPVVPATTPWCDLSLEHQPSEFRVQWASNGWMQQQAHALRRQVFCQEQGLFGDDDLDALDHALDHEEPSTRTLVALSCLAGEADEVLGTVRIHRAAPGVWWGSRLAVQRPWRAHRKLGSTLIQLAVTSAHAQGCDTFLAHVQAQNLTLFQRLHWQVRDEMVLHGRMHALMQADLAHYPPCHTPYAGFVIATGGDS